MPRRSQHDRGLGPSNDLLIGDARLFLGKRMHFMLQIVQVAVIELDHFTPASA